MRRFFSILVALLIAAPAHPQARITTKPAKPKPSIPAKSALLTQQERAQQLLNRFTFGPRPGDLEKVLALTPEKWFEQQLNPASIPDPVLDRRLGDFTTLSLQPEQALQLFPDKYTISQVADGRHPYPNDPLLIAMYEVQVYKLNKDIDTHKLNATGQPIIPPPTDAEVAAQKKT